MIELPPLPEILTETARAFADAWAMPGGRAHTDAMSNLESVVRAYGEACARAAIEAAARTCELERVSAVEPCEYNEAIGDCAYAIRALAKPPMMSADGGKDIPL
jgi:hypothetical protein